MPNRLLSRDPIRRSTAQTQTVSPSFFVFDGTHARETVERVYGWDAIAEKQAELYGSLVREDSGQS